MLPCRHISHGRAGRVFDKAQLVHTASGGLAGPAPVRKPGQRKGGDNAGGKKGGGKASRRRRVAALQQQGPGSGPDEAAAEQAAYHHQGRQSASAQHVAAYYRDPGRSAIATPAGGRGGGARAPAAAAGGEGKAMRTARALKPPPPPKLPHCFNRTNYMPMERILDLCARHCWGVGTHAGAGWLSRRCLVPPTPTLFALRGSAGHPSASKSRRPPCGSSRSAAGTGSWTPSCECVRRAGAVAPAFSWRQACGGGTGQVPGRCHADDLRRRQRLTGSPCCSAPRPRCCRSPWSSSVVQARAAGARPHHRCHATCVPCWILHLFGHLGRAGAQLPGVSGVSQHEGTRASHMHYGPHHKSPVCGGGVWRTGTPRASTSGRRRGGTTRRARRPRT